MSCTPSLENIDEEDQHQSDTSGSMLQTIADIPKGNVFNIAFNGLGATRFVLNAVNPEAPKSLRATSAAVGVSLGILSLAFLGIAANESLLKENEGLRRGIKTVSEALKSDTTNVALFSSATAFFISKATTSQSGTDIAMASALAVGCAIKTTSLLAKMARKDMPLYTDTSNHTAPWTESDSEMFDQENSHTQRFANVVEKTADLYDNKYFNTALFGLAGASFAMLTHNSKKPHNKVINGAIAAFMGVHLLHPLHSGV